ncbi:unnamed protein product [Plutella xylostella]|uniref:(diamondback moth) hypothetical protein n=1 Tax=Plutella xylostella TaxID=51655 RepID=A0A8S4G919_PLUXY|nr:unnamed protein product [Plutella xylostella]
MLLKWFVLAVLASMSTANSDYPCEPDDHYVQNLGPLDTGLIFVNPRGGSYKGEKLCYWFVTCPVGADVIIDCPFVDIPESHLCKRDRLLIKRATSLAPQSFCGNQTIRTASYGNVMGVSFQAPDDTKGGHFQCQTSCNFALKY